MLLSSLCHDDDNNGGRFCIQYYYFIFCDCDTLSSMQVEITKLKLDKDRKKILERRDKKAALEKDKVCVYWITIT